MDYKKREAHIIRNPAGIYTADLIEKWYVKGETGSRSRESSGSLDDVLKAVQEWYLEKK